MNNDTLAIRMEQNGVDFWSTLAGGAAGAKVLDLVINYIKDKRKAKKSASESISKTVQIYTALQNIPAHQCLRRNVFKAHNSGKMLDTRTHKYVSLLYEDFKHPFESSIDDIQSWRMDESYARLLATMVKERMVHMYIDDMENGKLRDLYESQDVRYSCLYYIGEDGMNLYYASFATNQTIQQFDVDTRNGINVAIDKIKNLMNF